MPNQEYASMDTTQLATQAQAAYEQGRARECLTLTKALAQADPGNVEAQALEAAIRSDIQQDLHDARCLLEHSGTPEEKKKYFKAAEIILVKALLMDPDNEEAKMLMQSTRALSGANMSRHTQEEIPYVAALPLPKPMKRKFRLHLPLAVIAVVLVAGGLYLHLQSRPKNPNAFPAAQSEPVNKQDSVTPPPEPQNSVPATPLPVAQTPTAAAATTPSAAPTAPATPDTPVNTVPAAPETGKLILVSPVYAEIYMGGRHLGTTPTTLQLPVGRQTLEYRRGNLRTVMTHNIKPNETTTAYVTFQVSLQINAKPWAQVFVDGTTRKPLGQTPLSGVTVPVGSVLVFENPNFAAKSYQVTEKDAAIQVDFQ